MEKFLSTSVLFNETRNKKTCTLACENEIKEQLSIMVIALDLFWRLGWFLSCHVNCNVLDAKDVEVGVSSDLELGLIPGM